MQSQAAAQTPQQVTRARLIVNPQAWHGESEAEMIEHISDYLAARQIHVDPVQTTPEEHGAGLARAALEAGYHLIIAAGGDGTIHEVAKSLIGTKATLGIIPVGTMNNVAHSLDIPDDIDQACEIIATGHRRQIDVGIANGKSFLEVVSLGFEVPLFTLGEETRHRGFLGTMQAALGVARALFRMQPLQVTLELDGRRKLVRAQQITICNTPRYGLGFQIAPDARMDDGLLDVVIARHTRRWELIRHYWSIMNGQRQLDTRVHIRRARRIRVLSRHVVPIAVDGEAAGVLPATISVAARRLTVMTGSPATEPQQPNSSGVMGLLRSMAPHEPDHAPNVYTMPENAGRMQRLTTRYWLVTAVLAALAFGTRKLGWWRFIPTPTQTLTSTDQERRHATALRLVPLGLAALFWRLRMRMEAITFLATGLMGSIITPLWRRVTQRFPDVVEPDDATMHAVASVGILSAGLWASRRTTWRRWLLTGALATLGTWFSFLDRRSTKTPEAQRDSIALGVGLGALWLGAALTLITWLRQSLVHLTNTAESPATAKADQELAGAIPTGVNLSVPIAMNTPLERGDILLFGPDGTIGAQFIEFLTRSYYHHMAIYDGAGMVIEAMPEGVRRAPLGERRVTGIRLGIPAPQRHAVADWAGSHVGDPYDSRGLVLIAFDRIFPGLRLGGPPAHRFSCAVFVADAYMQEGYDLLPNQRWQDLVPGDFIALVNTYPKPVR
jgi:YegS/Rv2252/BmrU family lipid kinase